MHRNGKKGELFETFIKLSFLIYEFLECQDPWNYNPLLSIPVCTNLTQILGSYGKGPANFEFDSQYEDRRYMSEKELTEIERDGIRCLSPCQQIKFETDLTYLEQYK